MPNQKFDRLNWHKEQLGELWDLCVKLELQDEVLLYLHLLQESKSGAGLLAGEDYLLVSLDTLLASDKSVAQSHFCSLSTVSNARKCTIAALIYVLRRNGRNLEVSDKDILFHLKGIENALRLKFTKQALSIVNSQYYQEIICRFFRRYVTYLDPIRPFTEFNLVLTPKQIRYCHRGVREFLNPQARNWTGFPIVLRQYVFAYLRDDLFEINKVAAVIESIISWHLSRNHPQRDRYGALMRLGKNTNLSLTIRTLTEHVALGGTPAKLGADYSTLASFIYSLYLIPIEEPNPHLAALSCNPNQLLFGMRKVAHIWDTET